MSYDNYDYTERLDRGVYSIDEVARFIGLASGVSLSGKLAKDTPIKNQEELYFGRDFEYDKEFVTLNGRKLKGVRGYYARFDGRGYKRGDCVYAEFETPDGLSYSYYLRPKECDEKKGYISVAEQINSKLKSIDAINVTTGSTANKIAPQDSPVAIAPKPRYYQTNLQSGIANAYAGNSSSDASAERDAKTPPSTVTKRTTAEHIGTSYSSHAVSHTGTSQIRTHSTQVISNTSVSKSQNAPQPKSSAPNNTQFFAKGNENNMTTFGNLTKLDEESLKEFYTSLSDFISKVTKSCDKMDSEIASCDEEMRDPLCQNILSVNRDILIKIRNCIKPAEDLKLKIDKLFTDFESVSAIGRGLE